MGSTESVSVREADCGIRRRLFLPETSIDFLRNAQSEWTEQMRSKLAANGKTNEREQLSVRTSTNFPNAPSDAHWQAADYSWANFLHADNKCIQHADIAEIPKSAEAQ